MIVLKQYLEKYYFKCLDQKINTLCLEKAKDNTELLIFDLILLQ